jgi:hypothetical protein
VAASSAAIAVHLRLVVSKGDDEGLVSQLNGIIGLAGEIRWYFRASE